ncbi:sugar transferase [Flavobacterium sp. J27]|uniref:sugar transferase n=1 Tax=Flavobacterium sp. J27 TaxID=2060419 RepID=UPI0010310E3D|nr:sugar transferase [Flavobacterium sp. J27]
MYKLFLKRVLDFSLSLIGFILLFPIFIIIVLCLTIANNGKPFFIQKRPGYKGVIFNIIKFKTMNDKKDKAGNLLPDGARLTRVGKFIRKTSLDEIPQLLNVIKGDMSLIGPRPLLTAYLPLYNDFQKQRHLVRPGITGWAQINGRNAISWNQKFEYDVWYVKNYNFFLDLKILFLTFKKVFVREGISQDGEATMEVFKGNS